jgi:hypothetical protein
VVQAGGAAVVVVDAAVVEVVVDAVVEVVVLLDVVVLVDVVVLLDVVVLVDVVVDVVVLPDVVVVVVVRTVRLLGKMTRSEWHRAKPAGTGPQTGWCSTPVLLAFADAAGEAPGLAPAVPTRMPVTATTVLSASRARNRGDFSMRDLMDRTVA